MGNCANETIATRSVETKRTNLARELFTSNFWMSGLSMLKYVPHSFRVKQVDGVAFLTDAKHEEFRNRVLRITPANPQKWGTMNLSQMLHHVNLACGSALGFYKIPDESYLSSRTLFRWVLVDWFPEQPVGLRLPKGFKIPHDAEFDFDLENNSSSKSWMPPGMQDHQMTGDRTRCSERCRCRNGERFFKSTSITT